MWLPRELPAGPPEQGILALQGHGSLFQCALPFAFSAGNFFKLCQDKILPVFVFVVLWICWNEKVSFIYVFYEKLTWTVIIIFIVTVRTENLIGLADRRAMVFASSETIFNRQTERWMLMTWDQSCITELPCVSGEDFALTGCSGTFLLFSLRVLTFGAFCH